MIERCDLRVLAASSDGDVGAEEAEAHEQDEESVHTVSGTLGNQEPGFISPQYFRSHAEQRLALNGSDSSSIVLDSEGRLSRREKAEFHHCSPRRLLCPLHSMVKSWK